MIQMQMHRMPPDTRDKERIFGGVLTAVQAAFLGGGFVLGLALFAMIQSLLGFLPLSVIFFLAGFGLGGVFALYKKHDLMLHTYLLRKRKFDKKTKQLVNRNVRCTESSIKKYSLMTDEEKAMQELENDEGGN